MLIWPHGFGRKRAFTQERGFGGREQQNIARPASIHENQTVYERYLLGADYRFDDRPILLSPALCGPDNQFLAGVGRHRKQLQKFLTEESVIFKI